ncbi:hypothetical protein ACFE04_001084 [Oxalis oulophora]
MKFVWKKKIERDVSQGVPLETFSNKAEKKRQRERMAEIVKVKKRREERAVEKRREEEERALLSRDRARAEFHDWEKKEAEFLFNQSKVRSEIRLSQGRTKPIDVLLSKQLEIDDPSMVFKGLTIREIEEVYDELKLYLGLDRANSTEYWEALMVVCDWELAESRRKDALDRARVRGEEAPAEERGLHSSIEADVWNLLQGKTYKELVDMQTQIESQMRSGAAKVVEYWEAILKSLPIFKAKACLREIHTKMLCNSDRETKHMSEAEDIEQDTYHAEDNLEMKANKAMGVMEEGDAVFGADSRVYLWHDKSTRKPPKYINRVHTGYEWNKYNQTHYDHDNPPPKMVRGYKFNIFYPDLVDKIKAPTYAIENDGNSSDTCIIRFHAGPPYEDIAFRIVNKEWDYSNKKGFKCTFERGILHVYFNFQRYRYRR